MRRARISSSAGYEGGRQDPFDDAARFGFSFGPSGLRVQQPRLFGEVFKEMEEVFGQLGRWEQASDFGNFGKRPSFTGSMSDFHAPPFLWCEYTE